MQAGKPQSQSESAASWQVLDAFGI